MTEIPYTGNTNHTTSKPFSTEQNAFFQTEIPRIIEEYLTRHGITDRKMSGHFAHKKLPKTLQERVDLLRGWFKPFGEKPFNQTDLETMMKKEGIIYGSLTDSPLIPITEIQACSAFYGDLPLIVTHPSLVETHTYLVTSARIGGLLLSPENMKLDAVDPDIQTHVQRSNLFTIMCMIPYNELETYKSARPIDAKNVQKRLEEHLHIEHGDLHTFYAGIKNALPLLKEIFPLRGRIYVVGVAAQPGAHGK